MNNTKLQIQHFDKKIKKLEKLIKNNPKDKYLLFCLQKIIGRRRRMIIYKNKKKI